MQEYLSVVKQYVVFIGRAGRREYWMFVLVNLIISLVLNIVDSALGTKTAAGGLLADLYSLAVFLPSLAVSIRRLHDINKTGWWLLIAFIPLIGTIWLIVMLAQQGDTSSNQYGDVPVALGR